MAQGGSQSVILPGSDRAEFEIEDTDMSKKNCCSTRCKKIVLIILTIIVIVIIWVSFFASGGLVFILDQHIQPGAISSDPNINMSLTYSSNDLPIVYIFVRQLVINDSQIFQLHEIYLRDLNNAKFNFSLNNCTSNGTNCTNEGTVIAYLSPILLTTPNLVVTEEYLLFDFSNVSFSNADRFYRSNVSILNITTTGQIDNDIKLEQILFGVNVQCQDGYEFDTGYRFCVPDDFISHHWHPSGTKGRLVLRIGIAFIAIIGLISSILSLTTIVLRFFFGGKNTQGAVQQSKLQRFFETLWSPSLLFLYSFASFCVVLLFIFDLPDPSVTYQKQYNTQSDLILLNLYGALFHFCIFGFFFWVNFTLFNLLITKIYARLQLKAKVAIVVTELVISIVIPLLLVVITLAITDGRAYMSIYIWLIVSDSDDIDASLPSLMLYFIPLFASCLGILTLTPLIVAKIKWDSLESEELNPNKTKVTGLQYRILLYAIMMFILYVALLTGLILYITIYQSNLFAIYTDEFGCLTSQRPSSIYRNNKLDEYDTLLHALRSMFGTNDEINRYIHQCYVIDKTNTIHPGWLFIVEAFLIRILIICIFIVTLPSKSNYYVWKNFIVKLMGCCKKSDKQA